LLTTQTAAAAAPTTKSYSKEDRGYKYWDDPNELIERLRLLLASESAGNTNHKTTTMLSKRKNKLQSREKKFR